MNWIFWLNIIGLVILIIGLITGHYIFLFLAIPMGLNFIRKNKNNHE